MIKLPFCHLTKFSTSLARPSLNFQNASFSRYLNSTVPNMAPIKVGDSIPSVDLFEGAPNNKVNLGEACKNGKFIIFGVPGAFTPGCSKTHLPGYVAKAKDLKAKGIKEIFCVSVNDPFVMTAWGVENDTAGKVTLLADTCGDFTRAIDLELDLTENLGNIRCQRFSIIVENGKATEVNLEPDGVGLTCSLAEYLFIKLNEKA